ncbi:MAG TPA: universal stress protein, partial [Arthrobacter sp.]|nr:universal stress protein [Arthrobacter sp.]
MNHGQKLSPAGTWCAANPGLGPPNKDDPGCACSVAASLSREMLGLIPHNGYPDDYGRAGSTRYGPPLMDSTGHDRPAAADREWRPGPVVLGVAWEPSESLIRAGASLAARLGAHLICAYVDPASYLTEWEPAVSRTSASLDPAVNTETDFPSGHVRDVLRAILGPPGEEWSFRVLNGAVAQALGRLAASTDASLLIVGGQRPGRLHAVERLLEGSVEGELTGL